MKIGSKDLKDVFKYYPIKKNDTIRVGDNIELKVLPESSFEEFMPDLCFICKVKYPESVEFVNLDCKHLAACRVCRFTEFLCPLCSEPVKTWETVSNVAGIEETDNF